MLEGREEERGGGIDKHVEEVRVVLGFLGGGLGWACGGGLGVRPLFSLKRALLEVVFSAKKRKNACFYYTRSLVQVLILHRTSFALRRSRRVAAGEIWNVWFCVLYRENNLLAFHVMCMWWGRGTV